MLLTSFPPVLTPRTTVVVLGSMPGQVSLTLHQYYGHPQNQFWPIMEHLFGVDRTLPYPERVRLLSAAGVGLWDVLKHCEREGSLDADIDPNTEVPNDFGFLFAQCPALKALCFNGQKAEKAFRRHVLPSLPDHARTKLELIPLPSTSAANAGKSLAAKVEAWRALSSFTPSRA